MARQPANDEEPSQEAVSDLLDRLLKQAAEDAKLEDGDLLEGTSAKGSSKRERRTAVPKVGRVRRSKKKLR